MADPTLATPALIAGADKTLLEKAPPAGSAFIAACNTARDAIVLAAPAFVRANTGTYPTNPTLATPVFPTGIPHRYLWRVAPQFATYQTACNTAAGAVTWTAPGYPHANTGVYP